MNYAMIENNAAVATSENPNADFHPDLAAQFVQVPDEVRQGWQLINSVWTAPVVVPVVSDAVLTQLEFRRLFTIQERITIDDADNSVTLSAEQKAVVRTLQRDMALATAIDLSDESTIFGVYYLEQCGLIASGRSTEILGS